ncbi:MAG: hypothetical protein ACE5JL_08440 [Dehalococcoidia bacterium]
MSWGERTGKETEKTLMDAAMVSYRYKADVTSGDIERIFSRCPRTLQLLGIGRDDVS